MPEGSPNSGSISRGSIRDRNPPCDTGTRKKTSSSTFSRNELVLIDDVGETLLRAGDAAVFPRGDGNGHHLVNRSDKAALYLEVGTRSPREQAHYPDDDLVVIRDAAGGRALHKSGLSY